MMLTSTTCLAYIVISLCITIGVSRTLTKNGEVSLIDGFGGNSDLARSVNHLLVVGFYLLNLGFVWVDMRTNVTITSYEQMIVYLSSGLGIVLLVLGGAHFFNMFVIHRFRTSYRKAKAPIEDVDAGQ